MNILAVDFETQCDQPKTTRVTEVGAAWKTVGPRSTNETSTARAPGKISQFCWEPDYPPQTEFIRDLTGITDEMLKNDGVSREETFRHVLLPLVNDADVIFAHKKSFDQTIFESTCKLFGLSVPEKEWICTLSEVKWPKKFTCHKLGHLAFEYGMFDRGAEIGPNLYQPPAFDRTKLHRAGDDAEILLAIVTQKLNLDEVLEFAREDWIYFKADPLPPWKDEGFHTSIAKKMGFGWESCRHDDAHKWPKSWVRRVKRSDYLEASKLHVTAPFRISTIEGL